MAELFKIHRIMINSGDRDVPMSDLGLNINPSQLKNEQQKLPKMVNISPYFLVLHFRENFMKILTNNQSYRCMKICIKMSFNEGQLQQ